MTSVDELFVVFHLIKTGPSATALTKFYDSILLAESS